MERTDILKAREAATKALAEFLRDYNAKYLANELHVSPRTVEGWKAENWPDSYGQFALMVYFGRPLMDEVFAPALDEAPADLLDGLTALEASVRAMKRQLAGAGRRVGAVALLCLAVFGQFAPSYGDSPRALRSPPVSRTASRGGGRSVRSGQRDDLLIDPEWCA